MSAHGAIGQAEAAFDGAISLELRARILVCDLHPLFRDTLCELLRLSFPLSFVAASSTLDETDVQLLLIEPGPDPAECLRRIARMRLRSPSLRTIFVSAYTGMYSTGEAARFGVLGSIAKSCEVTEVAPAILALSKGQPRQAAARPAPDISEKVAALTSVQLEIAGLLKMGLLNKQIAWEMGMTQSTAKQHLSAVFRALGVVRRTQAVIELLKLPERPSRPVERRAYGAARMRPDRQPV